MESSGLWRSIQSRLQLSHIQVYLRQGGRAPKWWMQGLHHIHLCLSSFKREENKSLRKVKRKVTLEIEMELHLATNGRIKQGRGVEQINLGCLMIRPPHKFPHHRIGLHLWTILPFRFRWPHSLGNGVFSTHRLSTIDILWSTKSWTYLRRGSIRYKYLSP